MFMPFVSPSAGTEEKQWRILARTTGRVIVFPANYTMAVIWICGGGGGGKTGTGTSGGGGGGAGNLAKIMMPSILVPPVLQFDIGAGGTSTNAGATSLIKYQTSTFFTAGAGGSGAAAATAGTAGTSSTTFWTDNGLFLSITGGAAGAGGAAASAAAVTTYVVGGGAGGGGTAAGAAGGAVTGYWDTPTLAGGIALSGNGNDGYWRHIDRLVNGGGSGGGGNSAGVGGNGGNGSPGAGGGGAGMGASSGVGGNGGDGFAYIWSI
jgi:hypothetical protein